MKTSVNDATRQLVHSHLVIFAVI